MSARREAEWKALMAARKALARQVEADGDLDRHLPSLLNFLIMVPCRHQQLPLRYLRDSTACSALHADPDRPTVHLLPGLLGFAIVVLGWVPKGYAPPRVVTTSGSGDTDDTEVPQRTRGQSSIATVKESSSTSSSARRPRSAGDDAR